MSTLLVICLIVSGSLIEIIMSSLHRSYGLLFALASFALSKIDLVLIFLSLAYLALHFFYVSSKTLSTLRLTEEARSRKGYLEAKRMADEIRLRKSLSVL